MRTSTNGHPIDNEATSPAPLEDAQHRSAQRTRVGLNLFWRTFFLLGLLRVGSILAWLQTLRALEFEPRTPLWSTSAARRWCMPMPLPAFR